MPVNTVGYASCACFIISQVRSAEPSSTKRTRLAPEAMPRSTREESFSPRRFIVSGRTSSSL